MCAAAVFPVFARLGAKRIVLSAVAMLLHPDRADRCRRRLTVESRAPIW